MILWYVIKHSPAHHPLEINYDSGIITHFPSINSCFNNILHHSFIHIKSMNLRAQKFAEPAYGCLSHLRKRSHPNQVLFIIVSHGTGIQLEKVVSCAHYHLWWFMRPSWWNPGRDIIIPLFLNPYRNRSPNESLGVRRCFLFLCF
jgi:hypothetical protein